MKAKNKSTSKLRCSKNQDRRQYSGSAVDQGNSGRSCPRVGSLLSLGSSCKRNRRYPKGSSLLRLAVSITLKHRALASAPLAVSQNKKFLLAITNDLTVRSATLFVSSSLPSSRTASNCFLWCSEYVCAFCRLHKSARVCHLHGLFPPFRRRFSATLSGLLATQTIFLNNERGTRKNAVTTFKEAHRNDGLQENSYASKYGVQPTRNGTQ